MNTEADSAVTGGTAIYSTATGDHMYSAIRIKGFRSLKDLTMQGLGRVNLLVGANNCGKTSVLEAVRLLAGRTPGVLAAIAAHRGEWHQAAERRDPARVDLSHLFPNRDLRHQVHVGAAYHGVVPRQTDVLLRTDGDGGAKPSHHVGPAVLHLRWSEPEERFVIPLVTDQSKLAEGARKAPGQDVQFIASGGLRWSQVVDLFEEVVLTEDEDLVAQCLRIVDPSLERIATVSAERYPASAGGMFVKLNGVPGRLPIGSAGDGMWRMLGLALGLVNAKGGVLLVDEIDTGLHYTVMEAMWRMIREQAAKLSVQVFATTHSRDCYESLAAAVSSGAVRSEAVSIQRIEKDQPQAVNISSEAIVAVAERGLEVR